MHQYRFFYVIRTNQHINPAHRFISFIILRFAIIKQRIKEYVSLYGKTKWAINGYSSNTGLIRHYIAPKLGELRLKEITPRVLEMFYQGLLKTPAVPLMTDKKYRHSGKFVQPPTARTC